MCAARCPSQPTVPPSGWMVEWFRRASDDDRNTNHSGEREAIMKTNPQSNASKTALTIRFHLTDGSVHSFVQTDDAAARKLWEAVDPTRLFARPRIVIGSEHSKAVFVSAETVRVDFLQDSFQCWDFPGGYSDIVELSEEEFRKHARLDQPS